MSRYVGPSPPCSTGHEMLDLIMEVPWEPTKALSVTRKKVLEGWLWHWRKCESCARWRQDFKFQLESLKVAMGIRATAVRGRGERK